jgi:hypothetical protein
MWRQIGGIVVGFVAWFLIVSVLNLGLRYGLQGYAAVEKAMTFTLEMMIARLSISAISSLAGGYLAALVGRGGRAPLVAGVVLLLMFIPIHYSIWSRFPIWYHLTFLISLPLLSFVGGRLWSAKPATA